MAIVISDSVVLALGDDAPNPRIGWHNLVTENNVAADEEDTDYPVENLANPVTYLYWKGTSTDPQSVTVTLSEAQTVNYIGVARHNFGSTGAQYVVESSANGSDWTELHDPRVPANDFALIHEFDDEFAQYFRVTITPGSAAPQIAVLYVGQITRLQRKVYVGHTPFPFGKKTTVSSGFSEDGQFLGRIVRRKTYESAISLSNLTPAWVRSELQPFLDASDERPYFWAWKPATYPLEVGYAWKMGDADVSNALPNGFMTASWRFQGIR